MTLEEDLQRTLREEAAKPAIRPDLLDRVRVGVRRDKRRRTAMLGAAALLTAAVAVPVVLVGRSPSGPARIPAPPSSAIASPPTPSPSVTLPSTVVWEKPRLAMPAFPLTPGWLPAGLGPRRVDQLGRNVLLMYEDGRGDVLSVEVGPVPGDWEVEGEGDHRSTVGSASATVRTTSSYDGARPGDRYVGVRWKLADGQWAQVLSFGPRTESQVLRFARGLHRQTLPASPAPFRIAEVPHGLTLGQVSGQFLCLVPPPVTRDTMQQGLCVHVEAAPAEKPSGVSVTVAGRPATFTGDSQLQIDLGQKRVLIVESDRSAVGLTADELVHFASGIEVAGP
ncbi:hypothetical protein ODJ79_27605 [Actinoplanes sp. KI2]|uniref:hypothetical protein n=1 Tax=Actinoplanes sp. KI2 TaxID=2983315 RepID=UPI0021D58800|nr:hypothetical protein [Actinoplanes sp. KI2]MCU7727501.1 hypothetical protein [Actinoplanes sp. KI2]